MCVSDTIAQVWFIYKFVGLQGLEDSHAPWWVSMDLIQYVDGQVACLIDCLIKTWLISSVIKAIYVGQPGFVVNIKINSKKNYKFVSVIEK